MTQQMNYVKDNITKEQREALKSLSKWNADPENDRMFTVQDKGSRLVTESKQTYIEKIDRYISDERTFRKDSGDKSMENCERIHQWCEKWAEYGDLTEKEAAWIQKNETKPGKIRANIKMHKETQPYRFIISSIDTAIENIGQWVEYHLSPLAKIHPAYLKDSQHFLRYIEQKNKEEVIT